MFDGISLPVALLVLPASLAVLVASGRYAIRFLSEAATAFGVSDFIVAFVILAVATSLPEVFVAVAASLQQSSEIIVSTALGSNIINITFIIGIAALLSGGVKTDQLHLKRDLFLVSVLTILPILFLLNGVISRFEGLLLLLAFFSYLAFLAHDHFRKRASFFSPNISWGLLLCLGALASIGFLLFSSNAVVGSSVTIATSLGIPTFLIGLFLLAIGTSLPELITTVQSNRSGKSTMALGNVLGSNATNSTLVIGLASLIHPISVPMNASLRMTMLAVVLATSLLTYLATKRNELSVFDGLKLIGAFLLFGITILLFSSGDI